MPIFKRDNIIDTSSSVEALKITQRGDGNSFLVEDRVSIDPSPFVVKSDGKVGIGNTDPIYNLQVGNSTDSGFKIGLVATASAIFSEINFGRSSSLSTDPADIYRGVIGYSHLSESLYLSQNGSRALTISGSQSVGIGTTNPSEKLHVASGNIRIDDGYGIVFGTSKTASSGTLGSQTLSDYEEGTWTPVITGSTASGIITYSQQKGRYTKIGKIVNIEFTVAWSTIGTSTGILRLTNLPYANYLYGASLTDNFLYVPLFLQGISKASTTSIVYGLIGASGSPANSMTIASLYISASVAPFESTITISANGSLNGSFMYYVNA